MKRTLILLDSFLILLVVIIGFALYKSVQSQRNETSIVHNSGNTKVNHEIKSFSNLNIALEEIKNENFSTLSGLWKNKSKTGNTIELLISGPSATLGGVRYDLVLKEQSITEGKVHLALQGEGEKEAAVISVYPQGSNIPVLKADGYIDQTSQHDPTDVKKDRLMIGYEALGVVETEHHVLYREREGTI